MIDIEIDEVYRSEGFDGMKYASCLNSRSSMTVYMIRLYNYSASSEINCHFYFTYVFSSIMIDAETDEVCRSEDVEGTKNASCLNFCLSMTVYMIRVSDYSA
jgi:hypothetical protein